MLRVPWQWACASSSVALVQMNDTSVAICTVLPSSCEAVSFELDASITLSLKDASSLTSQDFRPVEEHHVLFLSDSVHSVRRFVEVPFDADAETSTLLRIWTPLHTYVAKTILCEGPRVGARITLETLFAKLVGRYVFVGCETETDEGHYRVHSMELQSGYRGLAFVGGTTRVRLNHKPAVDPPRGPLLGLDAPMQEFHRVLAAMAQSPGQWTGVCLTAPDGCGASALIRQCATERGALLVYWSPTTTWGQAEELLTTPLVVLCVAQMNCAFPASDANLARLTGRVLRRDVLRLTNGAPGGVKAAVVLVSILRSGAMVDMDVVGALFSVRMALEMPDAPTRAALLAQVRGGVAEDHILEAHNLVGQSSAAVLKTARYPRKPYRPPMKALHWYEIGGLEEVKSRLRRALILPRLQPEAFSRFGVIPPRGILLYGPPGCAKTSLVKALCSEGFFSFIYLDSAGLVSAYVGESERQLRDVFRKASQQAPCIVFFDEVEVLGGRRRSDTGEGDEARLLSTLLTEMDGFVSTTGVCFVGATNTPHLLDSALLRPGRFDYLVYVPLPPRDDRRHILALSLTGTAADLDTLADATEGFSGADLTSLCTEVLLDLLEGCEEEEEEEEEEKKKESAPTCLQDATMLTSILLSRAKTFHKTSYDASSLEQFHRDCSSFASSM